MFRWIPNLTLLWRYRRARCLFDQAFYLRKYPDVAAAQSHAWLHYIKHGIAERRKPNPLFEPEYYLTMCPEARSADLDPLSHFLETRDHWPNPHPLFDCKMYVQAHPEAAAKGMNPLLHSMLSGEHRAAEAGYFGVR